MIIDVLCFIVILLCTFAMGYYVALLRFYKALELTLDHAKLLGDEFSRGSLWAIEYILHTMKRRKI